MCVTNVEMLLSTKEQAVKAGTAVSTSRQYIRRTNQGQERTIINLYASCQNSISSSPFTTPGRPQRQAYFVR